MMRTALRVLLLKIARSVLGAALTSDRSYAGSAERPLGANRASAIMANIQDVCDYIIVKADEAGLYLNPLKLQKLLYYCQAWHLAFHMSPLFRGRFEAWVHGPVNREIFYRFKDTKSLYTDVTANDKRPIFSGSSLSGDERAHIDSVLEAYGKFTGSQLEELTHREDPWVRARGGIDPAARCDSTIDEKLMGDFYRGRIDR